MKIIRAKDYNDMSRKAANIISAQVWRPVRRRSAFTSS